MASNFQQMVMKNLEKNGAHVVKTIRLNESGYPDIIAKKPNLETLWIECKEENDTLKPLQKLRIDELNKAGYVAICLQKNKGVIYPENEYPSLLINYIDIF